ncbi:MAG: hypothetical protein IJZ56_01755 [Oscillospiraceae bacterium]|nr:hypothetical protein [Oscillospiraceae bacterium]
MKTFKSVYRYVLVSLLLVACAAWTVYTHLVVGQLEAAVGSADFIDLAVQSSTQAEALLVRLDQFRQFRLTGLIAAGAVLLVLVTMIVCQVIGKRWEKQGKNPFLALGEKLKKKPAVKEPVYYCPNCGTAYPKLEGYCQECGYFLEEKT